MPAPAPHAEGSPVVRSGWLAAAVEDSALVRLPVAPGAWAESLPPVPDGHAVTVSFSSPGLADEHGEALALLGYRVADGPEDPPDRPVAWMLVSSRLAQRHPTWWALVRELSEGVFRLVMGPALRRYQAILRAHLTAG
ncbi:MAG: hypothetical protein GEU81_18150 [Nitriliruptorales bacterium]|nr:hypothetical protein [Nitriliruptorales bacterium]